jgi:hypothetical protein
MPSIDLGVIETLAQPPIAALIPEAIPGPGVGGLWTGSGSLTLTRNVGPLHVDVDAFGIAWSLELQRPGMGYDLGAVTRFEERIVQIAVRRGMRDGSQLVTELQDFKTDSGYLLFAYNPLRVDFAIAPGCFVTFDWLVVLP